MQWNISFLGLIEKKIKFIKEKISNERCIFVLEELKQKDFEAIKNNINFNFVYSLDIRQPGKLEAGNRGLGVLIAYSKDIDILNYGLIERSLFPERTLFAEFKLGNNKINILGFHALTGVDYKKAKSAQFASIADFLNENELDFMCFDANEPRLDNYDISKLEFFDQKGDKGKSASHILGANKTHKLKDAFREYILEDGESYLNRSPLETSFVVTGGVAKRYDYILPAIIGRWRN